MNGSLLQQMERGSRIRVRDARRKLSGAALQVRAAASPGPLPLAAESDGFGIIAEIKKSSPSAGRLADRTLDIVQQACAYAAAGASAVSVLTEPQRFGGDMDDLARIALALRPLGVPAMRKDFLVDPYQVFEARAAGAGGVLLILRMLDDARLAEMCAAAAQCGLFVLLEAFDTDDLERVAAAGALAGEILIGINTRDLVTLKVEPGRLAKLRPRIPEGYRRVAESGIDGPEDAAAAARHGYHMALVGSALMRAPHPGAILGEMLEAGRAARAAP